MVPRVRHGHLVVARSDDRGAARALILAAAALLVIAVVAAGIRLESDRRRTTSPDARLRAILASSWVTDGQRGFFVEAPAGGSSTISLYQTRWWSQVARQTKQKSELDDTAVGRWLKPLLENPANEVGDTGPMPPIERLSLAVSLAIASSTSFDHKSVADQIASLRQADQYRPSPTAAPNFTTTATAVQILRSIGEPIPNVVTDEVRREYTLALDDRTASDIPNLIVPALTAIGAYPAADYPSIRAAIEWVADTSASADQVSRLAVSAALDQAASTVGEDPRVLRAACPSDPPTSSGAVDPHVLSDMLTLGCAVAGVQLPPTSSQGFPTEEALSTQIQASAQALTVAGALGVTDRYRSELAEQLRDPRTAEQPATPSPLASAVLAKSLGGRASGSPVASASGGQTSVQDCIAALAAQWVSGATADTSSWTQCQDVQGSMLGAVEDELVARLESSPAKHSAAMSEANTLSAPGHLFSMEVGERPDLWATLLGRWIAGQPTTFGNLEAAGFCDREFTCYETPQRLPGEAQPILSVAAGVYSSALGGRNFPAIW